MAFDFDLFVIGAGSGGVRAARFSANFGAKVAIAESRYLGGTCVNVGCVPKKLMVYAANVQSELKQAQGLGWDIKDANFCWSDLIDNKNKEIQRLNSVYKNLLINSGVTLIEGHARLVNKNEVEVNGIIYSAKHILIAVGGWPNIPDISGKEWITTSNEVFYLKELPKRVLVVGGGYIAVEFASIFNGMGSKTTLVHRGQEILRGFDRGVREHINVELQNKGINLLLMTEIRSIHKEADSSLQVKFKDDTSLAVDCVFYATGRRPMLDNLGLENLSVKLDARGFISVNEQYKTNVPSILAIGDVIGRVQLTPVALAEGMAVARYLFAPEHYKPVNYELIPTAVFSLPNIATVGLTEEQAIAAGYTIKVFESNFRAMKIILSEGQERTFMKVIVDANNDLVLGCHMVGTDAGEIIQGLAVALKAGATKAVFDETIGIHPTAAEEFVTLRTVRA